MNPAAENARRQLASAGRRKDFARRLGTGLAAGSLLLLAILLVALVDYWLMLPPAARWTPSSCSPDCSSPDWSGWSGC